MSGIEQLISAAFAGDRRALAKVITLVERGAEDARSVLAAAYGRSTGAHVIGITGPPGAGKSTLVDELIGHIRADDFEVAALLVDPSSPFSGGAILGDRIRMQDRVLDAGVYARSMASRGQLGGVSRAASRTLTVLDAAGFPYVILETVGVGQAEVDIAENADTTVVVLNPGWGDSIQAAKAGLLEIGDVFVVNKADRPGVESTVADLNHMLHGGAERDWAPPVLTTVAQNGSGVVDLWGAIRDHQGQLSERDEAAGERRAARDVRTAVAELLTESAANQISHSSMAAAVAEVAARRLDPWTAAQRLLDNLAV